MKNIEEGTSAGGLLLRRLEGRGALQAPALGGFRVGTDLVAGHGRP